MLCSLSSWWLHFSFRDLWLDLWPWCLSFFSGLSARFFLLFFSSDELWEQNLHQKHCLSLQKFHVNLCSFACLMETWCMDYTTVRGPLYFRHIKRPCIWWPMHIAHRITVSMHPHQIYSHTALLKTWCTLYIIRKKKVFTSWWGRKELLPKNISLQPKFNKNYLASSKSIYV